ncbi:MAG: hypothetical protein AAB473_02895 [Patescibacteria group bacterium]
MTDGEEVTTTTVPPTEPVAAPEEVTETEEVEAPEETAPATEETAA